MPDVNWSIHPVTHNIRSISALLLFINNKYTARVHACLQNYANLFPLSRPLLAIRSCIVKTHTETLLTVDVVKERVETERWTAGLDHVVVGIEGGVAESEFRANEEGVAVDCVDEGGVRLVQRFLVEWRREVRT
jgi:hypothetical protein